MEIPKTMKALVLNEFGGPLSLVEKEVPQPGPGQVLIKMAASPINPSDLSTLQGSYGTLKSLPFTPGLEGSGQVVTSGGGFLANYMNGKRVACFSDPSSDGLWAEYLLSRPQFCIPLKKQTTFQQGAMMLVNPLTAWAFLEIAKKRGVKAILNTAAASALGRMLIRMCKDQNLKLVNIVRRPAQVELLQGLGAEYVLDSSQPDFFSDLKKLSKELKVKIAFDAIAGEMIPTLIAALPPNAEVMVYGALSEEGGLADPRMLIFEDKKISGFWLAKWIRQFNALQTLRIANKIQKHLGNNLQTEIAARLSLEEAVKGPERYQEEMTRGKILIDMGNFPLT